MSRLVISLALLLMVLGGSAAQAAQVSVDHRDGHSVVLFHAGPGEGNRVSIKVSATSIRVSDPNAPTGAGPGCRRAGTSAVICQGSSMEVRLGDRSDVVWIACVERCVPFLIRGGPGNDVLGGAGGHDRIYGGPGADNLDAVGGADVLHGGPGPDALRGVVAGGHASVSCGPGIDIVFPNPTMTIARDCDGFGETGWGYSRLSARGEHLRLRIKTLGCSVALRVGRHGPIATVAIRRSQTPVRLRLPDHGRKRVQLFGRSSCRGDTSFRPLFRIAPH